MISNGKNGILCTQSKLILIIWSGLHDFSCIDQFSIWFFVVLQKNSISSCTWVKLPWQIGVNKKKQIISICRRKLSTTLKVQTRSQFEWTAAVIIPNRLCMLYMFSPLTTPTLVWNGKNPLSRVSIVFLSAFVFTMPDPVWVCHCDFATFVALHKVENLEQKCYTTNTTAAATRTPTSAETKELHVKNIIHQMPLCHSNYMVNDELQTRCSNGKLYGMRRECYAWNKWM